LNLTKAETRLLAKRFIQSYNPDAVLQEARRKVLENKTLPSKLRKRISSSADWKLYWKLNPGDPDMILNTFFKALGKEHQVMYNKVRGAKTLLKWWLEAYKPWPSPPQELYRERTNQFHKYFKTLRAGGHIQQTRQGCIVWHPDNTISKAVHLRELRMAIPLIKPVNDEDTGETFKYIDVMEYTLSANGSYALHIDPEDPEIARMGLMVYRRPHHEDWAPLEKVVEHFLKFHPKNDPNPDDWEDEEY